MKQKQSKITVKDYIKANRKGSRDAELEQSSGFISYNKIHKSPKMYVRIKKKWSDDVE